jgi:hypothetical protein
VKTQRHTPRKQTHASKTATTPLTATTNNNKQQQKRKEREREREFLFFHPTSIIHIFFVTSIATGHTNNNSNSNNNNNDNNKKQQQKRKRKCRITAQTPPQVCLVAGQMTSCLATGSLSLSAKHTHTPLATM